MNDNGRISQNMQRIEHLVQDLETTADPKFRAAAVELVQLLMELHGAGLARMVEIIAQQGATGASLLQSFGREELIGQLLVLYNLHPVDLETRVQQALDKVRPLLKSHGGDVELLGLNNGVVRLRLQGSCQGCPSSAQTLKNAIEAAIYEVAADVAGLEVVGVVENSAPATMVPLAMGPRTVLETVRE